MICGQSTPEERTVLSVLAPGRLLTAQQIQRETQFLEWQVRRAIEQLESRG